MVWLQRAALVAVVIALGWHLPTLFFDDAYITFRYAANIAAGEGFTYNPPERVLGTTTPLFTLLLAACAWMGFDMESAALFLGLAGHALLGLMALEILRLLLPERDHGFLPSFTGALLCVLHPHLAFTAMGGMETPLYVATLMALFAASGRGAAPAAAGSFGLAFLMRPDAVLAAPPAAWLLRRAGGRLAPAVMIAGAVVAPWVLFAIWYFGSAVPHSVAAKRVIHPYGPLESLAEFGNFLADDALLAVAVPLALWSLGRRGRPPLAIALAAFGACYLLAYIFSGITPFPWYVNPLIPPFIVLAVSGLDALLRLVPLNRKAAWVGILALAAGVAVWQLDKESQVLEQAWERWEGQYEIAARWIMNDSRPGDSVFVGEVGVIGYLLAGRAIIDSSGISSPEVSRIREGREETDPSWTREIIQTMKPGYITTSVSYLNIREIEEEPWFQEEYDRVHLPLLDNEGQVIYKRR